jgi:hypothetical protein
MEHIGIMERKREKERKEGREITITIRSLTVFRHWHLPCGTHCARTTERKRKRTGERERESLIENKSGL